MPEAPLYFDQDSASPTAFGLPARAIPGLPGGRSGWTRSAPCCLFWQGQAWARGPYINARHRTPAGGVAAFEAIQQGPASWWPPNLNLLTLGWTAGSHTAMATRYVSVPTRENRPGPGFPVFADLTHAERFFAAHPEWILEDGRRPLSRSL